MNLILVEGIPGTGKTSACDYIGKRLRNGESHCEIYSEGDLDHPVDYESTAFAGLNEFEELINNFPDLKEETFQFHHFSRMEGFFIPYEKLKAAGRITQECAEQLARHDVYEMPPEIYKELILFKWKGFADDFRRAGISAVTDCCFLQNPMTMLMAKYNESPKSITAFVLEIEKIIKELNPVLIYFDPLSVKEVIEDVKKVRSPQWFQHVSNYYTGQEYGKAHCLPKGIEGVTSLLEERVELEKGIISSLSIETEIIPVSAQDRSNVNGRLNEMIAGKLLK
ncbi:hypothetical protein [Bacillus sp. AK031]